MIISFNFVSGNVTPEWVGTSIFLKLSNNVEVRIWYSSMKHQWLCSKSVHHMEFPFRNSYSVIKSICIGITEDIDKYV